MSLSCYLQMCNGTLFSNLIHRRHAGSHLESVLLFITQTRAKSKMGRVYEAGEVKI